MKKILAKTILILAGLGILAVFISAGLPGILIIGTIIIIIAIVWAIGELGL